MKKKGQIYYFTSAERKIIKTIIDKKVGFVTTPVHYPSDSDFDIGIQGYVYKRTNEKISGSTLERLVGLRNNEKTGTNKTTINIVSKYLEFNNIESFLKFIEHQLKHGYNQKESFSIKEIFKNHIVCLKLDENKILKLKYLNENIFEVLYSENLKLYSGYKIEISQLNIGEELICNKVYKLEMNKYTLLGKYKSGYINKVLEIKLEL